MIRKTFILCLLTITAFSLSAQVQRPMNSADILQALKKLNKTTSVLYIAAHPDDENTRLISYLAGERNFRTGYLSITRGDGGQNLIGSEQGSALGLIRTHELLQARNVDGGEQFFTRANDFGYSKSAEETFRIWDKDLILSDVVWVIRNFKPDVIICRFPSTGEGGHGHHTASAILAEEAFSAAGDGSRFPEQLAFTETWKPRRLFWNTFNFGGNNTTSDDQLRIDVGIYNPLLGKGYGEIASESRSMHKSQGFGSARTRGSQIEYFRFIKGDSTGTDPFDGIDTSWTSFAGSDKISSLINKTISSFNPLKPQLILNDLEIIYNQISALPDSVPQVKRWKQIKLHDLTEIMIACAGLWMEGYAENYSYCSGDSVRVSAVAVARLNSGAEVVSASLNAGESVRLSNQHNKPDTAVFRFVLSDTVKYTNPYWLNAAHSEGRYNVSDQRLIGTPLNNEPFHITFQLKINGKPYQVNRPVVYKHTDPVNGEMYRPVEILPKVTIHFEEKVTIVNNAQKKTVLCKVRANTSGIKGRIQFSYTDNWVVETDSVEINLANKNDEQTVRLNVYPLNVSIQPTWLKASVLIAGKIYASTVERIEHDHIPPLHIISDASTRLVSLNIKTVRKKIGYIEGAGDAVAACLGQMGYDVTILTNDLLDSENLSKYEAIVTGVRAYNTNERLQPNYARLMEYIRQGGTLVVQYNTNNRIGPLVAKMAPYPFTISRERVTDENATMSLLKRDHKILTSPNTITDDDFSGWVQERGIYFATSADSAYTPVFETHDPGSKPLDGSLIAASYGAGKFIYTGLSFFRQLPAGVPGAYRLFSNLIEY